MTTQRWLLTTEDVSELTGKSTHTIRAAMRDGRLAASNKSGMWVTTRQAVAEWLGVDVEDVKTLYSPRNQTDTEPAA